MRSEVKILLASRSDDALTAMTDCLAECEGYSLYSRLLINGTLDPLKSLQDLPDLLILRLSHKAEGELRSLGKRPPAKRPPLIVIAEEGDAGAMRKAMKVGARDFITEPFEPEELRESVERVAGELAPAATDHSQAGEMTVVVNAKGGSGATFLACNLGHISAAASEASTALVSLELQFATLPDYFDLKLRQGLLQALAAVDEMDAVALDAHMTPHKSGLRMLAGLPDDSLFAYEGSEERLEKLCQLLVEHYQQVIVDVPRRIDRLTACVLGRADNIILVTQQSLAHLKDASRMLHLMRHELGIPLDKVVAVVNRYDKSAAVTVQDIQRALDEVEMVTIPNNYQLATESSNLGVPVYEHSKGAALTRALMSLETRLGGESVTTSESLFSKTSAIIKRGESWLRS